MSEPAISIKIDPGDHCWSGEFRSYGKLVRRSNSTRISDVVCELVYAIAQESSSRQISGISFGLSEDAKIYRVRIISWLVSISSLAGLVSMIISGIDLTGRGVDGDSDHGAN